MKVYRARIKNGYSDIKEKTVIAPTIDKALDYTKRFAKKNYYSSAEIQVVELVMDVDIYYKS